MVFLAVALALVASGVLWRVAVKAPVADSQQETNQAAGAPTQPPPGQDSVSLAVLPFVDLSPQRDQQYFSDGLAEELLNQLAQLPTLRVIGRTSSFAFRGRSDDLRKIGRALNVNHVLEGSVRKDGDRIRVAVQLIDAMDGSNVWSHTYERTLDDIFAIQEDIGRAVAAELRVRIDDRSAGRGETRNYAAFDEFLTARALLNSNVVSTARAAVSHLEQAVAFDPGYLNAWLWLIDSYTRQAVGDAERRADMKAAQQRAIEKVSALAPQSVYAAIADSYGALSNGQLEIAGKLLESTLDAPPGIRARVGLRYGQFLVSVGRTTAAVDQLMRTRAADPFDVFTRMQTILALEVSGQHDRADAEAAELLQLPGGDAEVLRGDRIARAMDRGDAKALKALLAAGNTGVGQGGGVSVVVLGDPQSARRELERTLNDPHSRLDVFAVTGAMDWAAFLGDSDLALRAAHQAVKLGVSVETWSWSLWRPVMKGVRGQPGFKAVVQEMGLVDYWRATGNWGDFCRPLANNDFECT
jgi:TolB-like protein/Tfp pilus assembly protein PilF